MKHTRIASFLLPLLLATACGGDKADPVDPDDDIVEPDPEPEPEVRSASIRLVDDGQPVAGATVFVHEASGEARETLETNEEGVVVIDDVPEGGVGVTFQNDLVDAQGGFATVFGVDVGDNLTFGTEAARPLLLAYTIPVGFVVADRYEVRARCRQTFETELGAEGVLAIPADCAKGETVDAAVIATDEDGETVAYAILRDLPVTDADAERTAIADFSASGWSFDAQDVQLIGADVPADGLIQFGLYAPGRSSALVSHRRGVFAEEDAIAAVAFSMLPELAVSTEAVWTMLRGNEAGETLASILLRKESMVGLETVSANLSSDMPEPMANLTVSSDLTSFAVGQPGAFVCETDIEVDATLYTIRATLGGDLIKWQVLAPGDTSSLFSMPKLPVGSQDLFPLAQLEQRRFEVARTSHSTQSYADVKNTINPWDGVRSPSLEDGDFACLTSVAASN